MQDIRRTFTHSHLVEETLYQRPRSYQAIIPITAEKLKCVQTIFFTNIVSLKFNPQITSIYFFPLTLSAIYPSRLFLDISHRDDYNVTTWHLAF